MNQKKIGHFLTQLRSKKEMSIEQVAEMLNVSVEEVSSWEDGSKKLETETIEKLANLYNVSVNEILAGKEKPPVNTEGNFLQKYTNSQLLQFGKLISCFFILVSFFMPYHFWAQNWGGLKFVAGAISGFNTLTGGATTAIIGTWLLFLGTIGLTVYSVLKLLESFGKNKMLQGVPGKTMNYIILGILGGCALGEIFIMINGIAIGFVFSLAFLVAFGFTYYKELKLNK